MDRDEAFARALPLDPGRTALLVVDMQRAFVEAKELGDMLRSTP
jgi:isochorismate hydrolase